jgi:hypothetical protein
LTFSAVGIKTIHVQADPIGVGKFLTVEIVGQGNVTATKVNSGEVWHYNNTDPATEYKLGAGTVSLQAFAAPGWIFSHWEGDLTGTANPVDYKSKKYGYVTAVFITTSFTITALRAPEALNGTITTYGDGVATPITGGWNVTIEYGGNQTFSFHPFEDNHVSSIVVDDTFEPYAENYTFTNVQSSHNLTVYFSPDGQAYIPAGSNVAVYLGDNVGLNFTSTFGGTATQENILEQLNATVQPSSLILWNIGLVVEVPLTDNVTITLPYTIDETHPNITSIFTSDSVDALYSDVNGDGKVDGDDVSDVANMIKTLVGQQIYDPLYDIDRNTILDQNDVHMINDNKGAIIEELEFDPIYSNGVLIGYLIYTGHFSIFRGR